MVAIFGCLFVLGAVLTGFSMAGGHVGALLHPSEVVTIGGASLGALVIMSPTKVLKDLIASVVQVIKGSPYTKQTYNELFGLLHALTRLARREGLLGLDAHVAKPHESAIFQKYPRIEKNHHTVQFLTSGLALVMDGKENGQIQTALEDEIKVVEREHHAAINVLTKTADALPGFGIVAAVLGIVITMQAIDGPASEIGHKVGAALVGTFLGILLSYGFFAPMAGRMEFLGEAESVFLRAASTGIVAMNAGDNPRDVVLRARRMVGTDCRPSNDEMAAIFKET
jgi:chemotaxis protein MotA